MTTHDTLLTDMLDLVERNISAALRYAEMRRQLADDEHRDPLPLYGAYRIERERVPVAMRKGLLEPPSRTCHLRRELFSFAVPCP